MGKNERKKKEKLEEKTVRKGLEEKWQEG